MAITLHTTIVRQISRDVSVAERLRYWIEKIQNYDGGTIRNVFETKVGQVPDLSDQGFIILWERDE